jgi:hypothetical protein
MFRVMGTEDGAANVTFATNNELVNRIYDVNILLPSRLFCLPHFSFRKYQQKLSMR